MNQSKFSLADLLTLLAALLFGFVCFLGTNFYTLGNTAQSIVLAVIITALLAGTAFGAKLLKRTSRNFKSCFIWEIILLVLFTAFTALFSYSPFPHYFTVSGKKADIQSNLTTSITQAENMFAEYEKYADNRERIYKSKLSSVAAAANINPGEYAEYGFVDNVATETQIENKMFTVHADLFPTNYSAPNDGNGIKEVAVKWLIEAKQTTESWKPIGVVAVVNEVEKNSQEWLNILIDLSKVREKGEQANDFEYSLSFDDVKNNFTTLDKPTMLTIGLAALAYVLMLLSWFITKRHSKFPGLKLLFGGGTKYFDNEL
jgi:energy-coupling factor transporter transmembrane protein EcfT